MFLIYPAVSKALERVAIGSFEHLLPIVLALVVGSIIILKARQNPNSPFYKKLFSISGVLISWTVIGFHLHKSIVANYSIQTDLPLYLCSLLAILIPIYTHYQKYWMFEILVFLIIAGTLQGVITPDIAEGFPSLDYFRYWIVHLGLLFVMCYSIFVLRLKPSFKSVFKSFLFLQGYVIMMIIVNALLDANYFYLNEKPKSASLLDYFGDWPYYILVVQIIVLPLFLLIYLPFHISKK